MLKYIIFHPPPQEPHGLHKFQSKWRGEVLLFAVLANLRVVCGACESAENSGKCAEAKRREDSAKLNPKGAQASARSLRIGMVGEVFSGPSLRLSLVGAACQWGFARA